MSKSPVWPTISGLANAAGYPVGFDADPEPDLFDGQWERNHELIEEIVDERSDRITLVTDIAYEGENGERAETDVEDSKGARSRS